MDRFRVYLNGTFTVEQEVEATNREQALKKAANAVEIHLAEEGVFLHIAGSIIRKAESVY